MSVSLYALRDRGGEKDYPSWVDGAPNLQTYLTALNKSQPIVQCQYELLWSRWPRAKFFSKNITIPGLEVTTQELNHAGFTIKIPTHVHYDSNEITLNIIADKEGFHYYDLRNMVLQTGHPLIAGDPRSTIGNPYGVSPDEDTIEVRLRNRPSDATHHHWIIHNFKPIGLGDIELSQYSGSFVEFELKGTFTHITYDCGKVLPPVDPPPPAPEDVPQEEEPPPPEDEEENDEEMPPDEEEQEEPQEPEDLRPPEPPEPPPEPEPTFTSIMSASDSYGTDGDSESQTSSISEVKMEDPVSDQDMQAAEQCNEELTEASDELEKELERIKNMPADPNYTPEHVEDELYNNVHTPNANQQDVPEGSDEEYKGDKVSAAFSTDVTLKSPEQRAAYDAAVAKYNQKTQASMNKFKDARQQNQQSGK